MLKSIKLSTNFSFRGGRSGEFPLPPQTRTIGELLRQMGDEAGFHFLDARTDRLRPDIEVTINGKDVSFFEDPMETPLREGDQVDVSLMTLGGG